MPLIDLFPDRASLVSVDSAVVSALTERVVAVEGDQRENLRVRRTPETMSGNEYPHITAVVESPSGVHYYDFDHLDGDIDEWPLTTNRDAWRLLHLGETIDWVPSVAHHMRVGHTVKLANNTKWRLIRELQGAEMTTNPSDPSVASAWVPA